jgi:hypothetical protein
MKSILNWISNFMDRLFGVMTAEEYLSKLEKHYRDNPEEWFKDNF